MVEAVSEPLRRRLEMPDGQQSNGARGMKRKSVAKMKTPTSAKTVVVPTENQMDHALAAFATAKLRYQLWEHGGRTFVRVLPEMMVGTVEFMGAKNLPPVRGAIPEEATITLRDFPD